MAKKQQINQSDPDLTDPLNIHYQKFFNQFSEIETLPTKEWKLVHVIAYFCQKYQTHYNMKYIFRFNSTSPSKCYEVWQFKKLGNMISTDPLILKGYIDWFFTEKLALKKRRITSLAFLTNFGLIQEYVPRLGIGTQYKKIDREEPLPIVFQEVIRKFEMNITTYGQLALVQRHIKDDPKYKEVFEALKTTGMDFTILEKVV